MESEIPKFHLPESSNCLSQMTHKGRCNKKLKNNICKSFNHLLPISLAFLSLHLCVALKEDFVDNLRVSIQLKTGVEL